MGGPRADVRWSIMASVSELTSDESVGTLVAELARLPAECEWVEFKENNARAEMIGETISALANAALLADRTRAYLVWGVRDGDHALVGTDFEPTTAKVGNENLENWLSRLLTPRLHFSFRAGVAATAPEVRLVVLEVDAATERPVMFEGVEYVRVGSYNKKLKEHPEHERRLWRSFETRSFESGVAREHLTAEGVLRLLDAPSYFELLGLPTPVGLDGTVQALVADRLAAREDGGGYSITNLGAVLFALDLGEFPQLQRKAPRVVQYKGSNRVETVREQAGKLGYAVSFARLNRCPCRPPTR